MGNEFYVNVDRTGKNILYRGIDSAGNKVFYEDQFRPTFYIPANKGDNSAFRTLDGRAVEEINPGTFYECKDFLARYKDVSGFEVYGNTNYVAQYIFEQTGGEDPAWDASKVDVAIIDIETECEHGFPDIATANERVIAITVIVGDQTWVFGLGEFNIDRPNTECKTYTSEQTLLTDFMFLWDDIRPEVVTGWNIDFFDIPYLYNRVERLLGENEAKKFSPWRRVFERTTYSGYSEQQTYDISGVAVVDYLRLYKTFTYTNQESYKLDHICYVELNEKKLSYAEHDSIRTFYQKDFQKFIEYNIRDVELIQKLDEKRNLMNLAITLAYSAKVNYDDVFYQLRMWDSIIYHHLMQKGIVIPQKEKTGKTSQYVGAYVMEPKIGMHDWIVSFDLASLYPNIIRQVNISPETMVEDPSEYLLDDHVTVDNLLDRRIDTSTLEENDLSLAANGQMFRKETQGFLAELMEKLYVERKAAKGKMIGYQKEKALIEREIARRAL